MEGCFIAVRSITRGLGMVELLRSQDTSAVGCTSGRSSEIDETKVARDGLKDRHSRHTTDLNSKSIDNCSSLFHHWIREKSSAKNSVLIR